MRVSIIGPIALLLSAGPTAATDWQDFDRLASADIRAAFADVRDDAEVQEGRGGSAVNFWHADGRFVSHWRAGGESGVVHGRWFVRDDERCVVIESGLPELADKPRCGPIYSRDGKYYSVNAQGGIHGIHTLSPLAAEGEGR